MKHHMRPAPDGMVEIARRAAAEVEQARVAAAGKECNGNVPNTCRMAYAEGQNFGGRHTAPEVIVVAADKGEVEQALSRTIARSHGPDRG